MCLRSNYLPLLVAKNVLDNWDTVLTQFVKVYPSDYRRVLEEAAEAAKEDEKSEAEREVEVTEGN